MRSYEKSNGYLRFKLNVVIQSVTDSAYVTTRTSLVLHCAGYAVKQNSALQLMPFILAHNQPYRWVV
jgi:hypothetical protein